MIIEVDGLGRDFGAVQAVKSVSFGVEAGEIFGGTKSVPAGATTVFKSVGLAIEDLAAARLVYDAIQGRPPGKEAGAR